MILFHVLQVHNLIEAHLLHRLEKLLLALASIPTIRDMNRSVITVLALVNARLVLMERLQLLR